MRNLLKAGLGLTAMTALHGAAGAQDADLAAQIAEQAATTSFVFNTLLFLIGGFLVMWMAAGFAMLEAGLVRSKNVSMQCLKNIMLYSVAGLMFWAFGYDLMYTNVDGGFIGALSFNISEAFAWLPFTAPTTNPLGYDLPAAGASTGGDYSVASDWFFQMVFCATTASIVSGTVAERVKFWPFILFVVVLTGILYPITGSWEWGAGWLDAKGFSDFAGSTLVHSVGGWAALAGAIVIGARKGKYGKDGKVTPMLGSSIPLATLGTFILWLGWFGFNGGSQLAMGTITDAADVSKIFANTNLAAAGGVVVAVVLMQLFYKKIDVTMALNGALAGLVAITAEPLAPSALEAILIGGVGGAIVVFTVPLLDKFKIDDVVGAIPVHLLAGIFGTLIVAINTQSEVDGVQLTVMQQLGVQALGVVAIGAFIFAASFILWTAMRMTIGVRVSEEDEYVGLDQAEVGVPSYPEFVSS